MRLLVWPLLAWLLAASVLVQGGTLAQFRTALGDIEVELFDQDKPATVANFIRYVEAGLYRDMIVHRWDDQFVIQGGGFWVTNRFQTNAQFASIPTFSAITNEYNVGRKFSNTYGTIAMARVGGQTNSATSQWFFNLGNNAFLDTADGGFTVFGRVLRGTNVLERFNKPPGTAGIDLLRLAAPMGELPVLAAASQATYSDLVYMDVTLLQVQVARAAAGREISWQSVTNKPNRVEFTSQLPPVWQELVSTNGTGQRMQVLDTAPRAAKRFYRVRVDY
jgi:cyclophilin family peptidyl-prolyl cis-trans isomerase